MTNVTYAFDKLAKDTQEKILDKYRYYLIDDVETYANIDDMEFELLRKGFYDIDIRYQLFGQGSGASFEAKIDIEDLLELVGVTDRFGLLENCLYIYSNRNDSMASHEKSVTWSIGHYHKNDYNDNGRIIRFMDNAVRKIEKRFNEWYEYQCNDIYNELMDAYEHLTEDETLIDYFNDCEITFYENGQME